MGSLNYDYTLTNGETADASEVQANFEKIRTLVNGNLDSANLADNSVGESEVTDKIVIAGGSDLLKIYGPYEVTTNALPSGTTDQYTITHNIGSTAVHLVGGLRDDIAGVGVTWSYVIADLNTITLYMTCHTGTVNGVFSAFIIAVS